MLRIDKCNTCWHRRVAISENGYHVICGLSSTVASNNCFTGKKDHYDPMPWVEHSAIDEESVYDKLMSCEGDNESDKNIRISTGVVVKFNDARSLLDDEEEAGQ